MLRNYVLLFSILSIIGLMGLTTSYTAPTYNDINFSLCPDYTSPAYNDINFTLSDDDVCPTGDTCTYTSGNWEIECSDICNISVDVEVDGSDLNFSGTGLFNVEANITGWGNINLNSGCSIVLGDGYSLVGD